MTTAVHHIRFGKHVIFCRHNFTPHAQNCCAHQHDLSVGRPMDCATTYLLDARLHCPADRMATGPRSETKNLGIYYRRPSTAIERGGGFFVPGLEGYRYATAVARCR